jgi:pilus assembly protein CpaE
MPYQLLIVSEDRQMAAELSASAGNLRPHWESMAVDDYATVGAMRGEIESWNQSALAMVVAITDMDRGLYLLQAVKQAFPEITTAAAHPAPPSNLIIGAMRAGAEEFLTPPYDLTRLAGRVEQAASLPELAQAGKLFCFIPAKGASGASTLALHLGESMSRVLGERVLFVDFDFHSGASAFRLRLKPSYTLVEALERTGQVRELWKQLVTPWKTLDILPAPSPSSALPVAALEQVPQFFRAARSDYSCVVVDMPGAILTSCRDVMNLADCVFLVCTPEVVSLHLAKRKIGELIDAGIPRDRIEVIVNRVNSGKTLDVEDISKLVGKPVYQTFENEYEAVTEASLRGDLLKGDSALGREFLRFASKILGGSQAQGTKAKAEKSKSWASFFSMK